MDKQAFFFAARRKTGLYQMPGFGQVNLQALTLSQRLEIGERNKQDQAKALAWIVCQGVVGLGDEDIDAVLAMDPAAIEALAGEVMRLSGFTADAVDDAKND